MYQLNRNTCTIKYYIFFGLILYWNYRCFIANSINMYTLFLRQYTKSTVLYISCEFILILHTMCYGYWLNLFVFFLGHQGKMIKWAFPITWHPASINLLYFDLLLQNHFCQIGSKLDEILLGWSSFKNLTCQMNLSDIQNGHQFGENWKSSSLETLDGMKPNLIQKEIVLGGPFPK